MVTFFCDDCQTSLKKAKVPSHGCRSALFSCVDCSGSFTRDGVARHTACRSEAEQVEGKLYKGQKFVQTADKYGNKIDPNKAKQAAAAAESAASDEAAAVGEKRKAPDSDGKENGSSSKRAKVDEGKQGWSELAAAVLAQVEKKGLMISKLKKKLKKSGAWSGDDAELGLAILELNAYATLSKTVVSSGDED